MTRTKVWMALSASALAFLAVASGRPAAAQQIDDTAYKSLVTPQSTDSNDPDGDAAENPRGRAEWMKSRLNGPITPEFSQQLITRGVAAKQAHPGSTPLGAAGSWVSLGPTNANRFQNGVNKPAVDSGRLRNILPDPRDRNVVYVLSSSGGLWKTTNFTANNGDSYPFRGLPQVAAGVPYQQSLYDHIVKDLGGVVKGSMFPLDRITIK